MEKTREVMVEANAILEKIPEVKTILASVGSGNAVRASNNASSETGSFQLILNDASQRKKTTAEVVDEISQKLNRFPGARVRVSEAGGVSLPGLGGNFGGGGTGAPISYAIRGNDAETLKQVAEMLTSQIAEVDGVRQSDNTLEDAKPEIQVALDRLRSAELGVTQSMISATIQSALREQVATKFDTNGTQIDVTLGLQAERTVTMQDIGDLLLTTSKGEIVQIKDVATVSIQDGPRTIQRFNQARVVNVTASLSPGGDLGSVTQRINKLVDSFPLPPGYVIEQQGQNQQMAQSTRDMLIAFALA
ncbi:efflux RND transporter permease subunit, partial [Microbacteriaceae bacterium K1510]|nr:efflux RND transporter permease subunit [Microbacteriaceae bacterium K1510]